ncbi:unnamed protein product [Callosobruchus maculatus]|uniref:Uncharacterized protein n=1 Tax=Callosobruchus maculatus TaxID=64391 RepID=A0A653DPS2_CALMS|nr:unnamed protein product [Callosobruchus maculatus]
MGLKFLGNPYDEDEYEDEGWDIADEEEWFQPPNVEMMGVFRLVASELIESDWQNMTAAAEDDEDDEDYCPDDEDLSHDDDDDDYDDYNPDDEDYAADEEVREFDRLLDGQRVVAAGDEDDEDEDEADYVTFPLARVAASTPVDTESEKTVPTASTTHPSSQSSSEDKSASREMD